MKYFVKFKTATGEINYLSRTKAKNAPTLTEDEIGIYTLAEIKGVKKGDIPEGQILGSYRIDLTMVPSKKFKLIPIPGVLPVDFTPI
jgi:hypothetical protein